MRGALNGAPDIMVGMFMAGIGVALVALIAFEIIQEARSGSQELHDHYHE